MGALSAGTLKKTEIQLYSSSKKYSELVDFRGKSIASFKYSEWCSADKMNRVFPPDQAKGGLHVREGCLKPENTACLFIEFQNEFTTEGGKLHDAVKGVMAETKMLDNAKDLAEKARKLGIKVM